MVKITDPNEDKNEPTNTGSTNYNNGKLTDNIIKDMLKAENKQSTTALNIRLETNITDQIELYANEHNTTKTEVIKKILTEHYSNKKITKGTFKLKEPVTLIIPRSEELLTEYIRNEVNIVSTIQTNNNSTTTINPLDPQVTLYNTENGYTLETLTHANNILDMYDKDIECYTFSLYSPEDSKREVEKLMDKGFLGVYDILEYPILYHRGLLYINIINEEKVTPLLIDVLCCGNELIQALIIDKDRAIELARLSKNMDLIRFLHETNEYVSISEMVLYDKTNKELREDNKILKKINTMLNEENNDLKIELESELECSRTIFNEKQDNEENNYIKHLKTENKELRTRIKKFEEKETNIKTKLAKVEEILKEYQS